MKSVTVLKITSGKYKMDEIKLYLWVVSIDLTAPFKIYYVRSSLPMLMRVGSIATPNSF